MDFENAEIIATKELTAVHHPRGRSDSPKVNNLKDGSHALN
jgi:hypothetical protein